MPIEQTAHEAMQMSKEIRIRVLETVNAYFVLFAAGLIVMGAGLVMQHGTPKETDRYWHHWR